MLIVQLQTKISSLMLISTEAHSHVELDDLNLDILESDILESQKLDPTVHKIGTATYLFLESIPRLEAYSEYLFQTSGTRLQAARALTCLPACENVTLMF